MEFDWSNLVGWGSSKPRWWGWALLAPPTYATNDTLKERLKLILNEIKDSNGDVILFIDNIHLLLNAESENGMKKFHTFKKNNSMNSFFVRCNGFSGFVQANIRYSFLIIGFSYCKIIHFKAHPGEISSVVNICFSSYTTRRYTVVIRCIPNEPNTGSLRPSYGHRNVGPGSTRIPMYWWNNLG